MFLMRDIQPFDPFLVGPSPVLSTLPPTRDRTGMSVSQDPMATNALMGQVALSKAINEEMVAAKRGVALQSRINAGAQKPTPPSHRESHRGLSTDVIVAVRKRSVSQSSESSSSNVVSIAPMKSLVGTQAGKVKAWPGKRNGLSSHASDLTDTNITLTRKRAMSQPANARNVDKRLGAGGLSGDRDDEISMKSNASQATVRSKTSVQLADNYSRVSDGSKTSRAQAGVHQSDHVSRVSVRSKASEQRADNISGVSVGSKTSRAQAGVHQSDHVSRVSVRSKAGEQQADNISHVSVESKASRAQDRVHQSDQASRVSVKVKRAKDKNDTGSYVSKGSEGNLDNISHASIKSALAELQADAVSQVSTKSKVSQRQPDNVSRVSVASKADNASYVSAKSKNKDRDVDNIFVKSKQAEPNTWPITAADDVRLGSKRTLREDFVTRDRHSSLATVKSLNEKTVELSDRLRAGNEHLHNRFHFLNPMYTCPEPLKRCREDRMSLWFKDSVLS